MSNDASLGAPTITLLRFKGLESCTDAMTRRARISDCNVASSRRDPTLGNAIRTDMAQMAEKVSPRRGV